MVATVDITEERVKPRARKRPRLGWDSAPFQPAEVGRSHSPFSLSLCTCISIPIEYWEDFLGLGFWKDDMGIVWSEMLWGRNSRFRVFCSGFFLDDVGTMGWWVDICRHPLLLPPLWFGMRLQLGLLLRPGGTMITKATTSLVLERIWLQDVSASSSSILFVLSCLNKLIWKCCALRRNSCFVLVLPI